MHRTKTLSVFLGATALAAAGIGAWLWIGPGTPPAKPTPPLTAGSPAPAPIEATAPITSDRPASRSPGPTPIPRITTGVAAGAPMVRTTPAPKPARPAASLVALPASQAIEPRTEVEHVQSMIRDFRTRMGENPVGSNAEIMKAVMGGNSAGARLGPPEGQALNADGELVDRWGTPYFFHQLGKDKMEIRSAGPDAKMWTPDDLVSR